MTLQNEVWKDIEGYEGWYQVSNLGRVKRLKKIHCNHGKVNIVNREHILTPSKDKKGYLKVMVSNGMKRKSFPVHRLVALAFVPKENDKNQVDHIDRNKQNNNVENLRWVNNSENQRNTEHLTIVSAFGFNMCLTDWSICLGVKVPTIISRLQRGWSPEDAVSIRPDTRFYKKGKI